jgi:hypothetical protein
LVNIVLKRKELNLGKVDQITDRIPLTVMKLGDHSIVEEIVVMTVGVGQVIVLIEGEVDEIEVGEEVIEGQDGVIQEGVRQEGEATQGEEVILEEKAIQENVLEDSVDQVALKKDMGNKEIYHQVRKMNDQNVIRVKAKANRKFQEVKVIPEAEVNQNTRVRVNQKRKNQF